MRVERIADILSTGKENAVKSSAIMAAAGIDELRTLQQIIENERNAGAMICACERGYYIAKDSREAWEYYMRATKGAKKLLYTLRHIKHAAETIDGQEQIEQQDKQQETA